MGRKLLAGVAALSLSAFAAACGSDDDETKTPASAGTQTTMEDTTSGAGSAAASPTETGAAELRAGLTHLLNEHVYLAGIAISQGVGEGLDSKAFEASAAALDENSVALSEAIGGVYGDAAGEQFLALWRDHIGMFVEYTKGKATGDTKLAEKARADLDGYRAEFGAFLASANPNLTQEAVAEELKPHVSTVIKTINDVIGGEATTFDQLREAASHMPQTAAVLAGAIAAQKPEDFDGDPASGASELRAGLTGLLNEHVYLAGIAVTQGVTEGLDSKQFEAAAGTLDANSIALSEAVGGVYGDAAGEQFLALWRDHIGMFVEYTKGKATGNDKLVAKAAKDLDGYRAEFGAFLASANPNLTADAVAEELKPHVASVAATVDSLVAGDGKVFTLLREAAGHMPQTANVLAGAIVKQMPDQFGA